MGDSKSDSFMKNRCRKGSAETETIISELKAGLSRQGREPSVLYKDSPGLMAGQNRGKENVDKQVENESLRRLVGETMTESEVNCDFNTASSNSSRPLSKMDQSDSLTIDPPTDSAQNTNIIQGTSAAYEKTTSSVTVPMGLAIPGTGLLLTDLTQQHTENITSHGKLNFQGSPSLSDLAKQHMTKTDLGESNTTFDGKGQFSVAHKIKSDKSDPLSKVGFSLGTLAQQHAKNHSSQGATMHQDVPSLSDLTRQQTDESNSHLYAHKNIKSSKFESGQLYSFNGMSQNSTDFTKSHNSSRIGPLFTGGLSLSALARQHEPNMDENGARMKEPLSMPPSNFQKGTDSKNFSTGLSVPLAALAERNARFDSPDTNEISAVEGKKSASLGNKSPPRPLEPDFTLPNSSNTNLAFLASQHTSLVACSGENTRAKNLLATPPFTVGPSTNYSESEHIDGNISFQKRVHINESSVPGKSLDFQRALEGNASQNAKTPPGFKAVNLAELASRHSASYSQKKGQESKIYSSKRDTWQSLAVAKVRSTRASIFGHALCSSATKSYSTPPAKVIISQSKFSYRRQISHDATDKSNVFKKITPFDFSTQSPDDIVKKRQRCAFTRTGERKYICVWERL